MLATDITLGMTCLALVVNHWEPCVVAHRAPEGRYILEDKATGKALPSARSAHQIRPIHPVLKPGEWKALERIANAGQDGLRIPGSRIRSEVFFALEKQDLIWINWIAIMFAERVFVTDYGTAVLAARKGAT